MFAYIGSPWTWQIDFFYDDIFDNFWDNFNYYSYQKSQNYSSVQKNPFIMYFFNY